MSVEVTTAQVKQYSANVIHLAQQKASRLRPFVRAISQKSEEQFHDRIGKVEAQEKVGRHSDVTYQDTPHSRRRVTLKEYFYADMVDEEDKLRILQNPESEYAMAASMAIGRKIDDVLIAAALGSAFTGKDGGTAVAIPDSQKIVAHDGSTLTGVGLNVRTLRAVKKKFFKNEAGDGELYFCLDAEGLDDLLGETEVTSSDYAAIKALVNGDINSFMGFKFLRSEKLLSNSAAVTYNKDDGTFGSGTGTLAINNRRAFAWQREGMLLSIGMDMVGRVSELPEKHYAKQVYFKISLGAVRLEEERLVEVLYKL